MSYDFTANEIFEAAIRIEVRGKNQPHGAMKNT
jgi:hypothetical protein